MHWFRHNILCRDVSLLAHKAAEFLVSISTEDHTIGIKKLYNRVHIDFYLKGTLILRFDIFNSLGIWRNTILKNSYSDVVIESSRIIIHDSYTFKAPTLLDEAVIRYIEYHEYFGERPDKIKHINFIAELFAGNDSMTQAFFNRLHDLPLFHMQINLTYCFKLSIISKTSFKI